MLRAAQAAALIAFVITVVVSDWRWRRIPNVVTYPTILLGVALGALEAFPGGVAQAGFLDRVAGAALALAVTYPLYAGRMLKGGDAKLLMAIGALGGVRFFISAALYGSVLGGVLALILIAARRLDPPDTEQRGPVRRLMRSQLPYGVALGLGALVALGLSGRA